MQYIQRIFIVKNGVFHNPYYVINDRLLTKSDHPTVLVIEKVKKHIIRSTKDNTNLFLDYVIDEAKAKENILSLSVMDFSEILQNEHKGFEHEKIYVFGKDVTLLDFR